MSLVTQLQEEYKDDAHVQAANKKEMVCRSQKCKNQISLFYQVHERLECLNCGCSVPQEMKNMEYTQGKELVIGPCSIAQKEENGYEITFFPSDDQLKEVRDILDRIQAADDGYTWQEYIESSFPDEIVKPLDFDSENGMFCAYCDDQEPLIKLAQKIKDMIDNPDQLRAEMAIYDQEEGKQPDKTIGPCLIRHELYNDMPYILTFQTADEQIQKLSLNWQEYLQSNLPTNLETLVVFDKEKASYCATCETQEPLLHIAYTIQAMIDTKIREEMEQYDQKAYSALEEGEKILVNIDDLQPHDDITNDLCYEGTITGKEGEGDERVLVLWLEPNGPEARTLPGPDTKKFDISDL